MFYAPNLTTADIGSKGDFENGLPSIAYQGPHGDIIVGLGEHAKQGTQEQHADSHE
jgi:hypothetical protein